MSGGAHGAINPYLRRWMLFVDGEGFTIRGQNYAQATGIALNDDARYMKDVFLWFRDLPATLNVLHRANLPVEMQVHAMRSFCYTSVQGDNAKNELVETRLHEIGFNPRVFKKEAN